MYFDSSWSADYLHVCITLHQFENFAFFILKLSIWFELTWFVHHFILFENFHLKFIYCVVMCSENRQKWCNHAWSVQNEFKLNDTNLNMKHIIITTLCWISSSINRLSVFCYGSFHKKGPSDLTHAGTKSTYFSLCLERAQWALSNICFEYECMPHAKKWFQFLQ